MYKREYVKKIILCIVLIIIIYPIWRVCFYALPSADDFTNSLGWKLCDGRYLQYMFQNLIDIYQKWQGTYFGVFISGYPIYYELGLEGLRLWLFFVVVLFFFAVYFFCNSAVRKVGVIRNKRNIMTLMLIVPILFYVLGTNKLDEIFYWYTGTCTYTLPMAFSLLCISCYMMYEIRDKKNLYLILGILLAIGGAGGALDIAAMLCSMLFLGIIYNWFVLGRVHKNILIGITAVIGAIINVAAPGNFARHSVIDSEIRFVDSIINVFLRVNEVIFFDIKSGFLLLIIIVSFFYAFKYLEDSTFQFKYPGLVMLYSYMAVLVTDFPVILGYSSADLPGRCAFVEHLTISIYVMLTSVYWGGWLAKKNKLHVLKKSYLLIVYFFVLFTAIYCNSHFWKELTPLKMIEHLYRGDYETVSARELNRLQQIENSKDKNVVVYSSKPVEGEWINIKKVGLSKDSSSWINVGIANYYDKDTIILQYIE